LQTGEEEGPSLRPRRRKRRTEPSLMGREGKGRESAPYHDGVGGAGGGGDHGGDGTAAAAMRTRKRNNPTTRLTEGMERSGGQLQLLGAGHHRPSSFLLPAFLANSLQGGWN
jgi:hypothetical protein